MNIRNLEVFKKMIWETAIWKHGKMRSDEESDYVPSFSSQIAGNQRTVSN